MSTTNSISVSILIVILAIFSFLSGCSSQSPLPSESSHLTINLTSDAFLVNGNIPSRYTCDGEGISPPLSWGDVPEGTQSFCLVLEDPDAPAGTYIHWVLYNIPGEWRNLPAGIPPERKLTGGGLQGTNSAQSIGYIGPCPPPGSTHRYILNLWALDDYVNVSGTVDAATLRKAMEGHVLGTGQLIGTYKKM